MCGIVGAVADRDIVPMLIEGLRRLEYRGYDSAGLATCDQNGALTYHRAVGKIANLDKLLQKEPLNGHIGIAHTRWATHGVPSLNNAHPQISRGRVALVHNGIIEEASALRAELVKEGYEFASETDTEVMAHYLHRLLISGVDLPTAVLNVVQHLKGAFAIAVIDREHPDELVAARVGCPLLIGLGEDENFVASDLKALLPVTRRFVLLEDGDVVHLTRGSYRIVNRQGVETEREHYESNLSAESIDRGQYPHFMLKEIMEQPAAIATTLDALIDAESVRPDFLPAAAQDALKKVEQIHLVACGTSFHAALLAREWIESSFGIRCIAEIASEYRYRTPIVPDNTLLIVISQSGETLDTLEALRLAKQHKYLGSLAICNVAESALTREADWSLLTRAGPEIGVASTKAFTTQLVVLAVLALAIKQCRVTESKALIPAIRNLRSLPALVDRVLAMDSSIKNFAKELVNVEHALYLGRGTAFPVALEGALKLKEISYIHAEAYPAGELKHGPLALIDRKMPVITLLPFNALREKTLANIQEVRARQGRLMVIKDPRVELSAESSMSVLTLPGVVADEAQMAVLFTIPLQLLAYHVGVLKGIDVDQPRNLAKSVTVE